jgi:16S rRNA (guanine966-N2)-methyltransferase
MRIISGTRKGLSLEAVPGKGTRPTVDKVKESIFNMIGPYFTGGIGLDLYAGTGSLGIEALSRGLDRVIFVDLDPRAVEVVKQNLRAAKFLADAEVYRNDARRALKALKKREIKFDLAFLDPPYAKQQLKLDIDGLVEYHLLAHEALIVVETDAAIVPREFSDVVPAIKETVYGNTRITVFQLP